MADSAGEKTELPTPKKLRDARQKGQVCTSKDITSTAILVVLFALLAWVGVTLMNDMEGLLRFLSGRIAENDDAAVRESSAMAVLIILKHSFIFVAVAAVGGIIGNVAQGGFLFTKLFVNDQLDQTGFISSAELTDAANDKYLEYAKELEITIERRIIYDDPYFREAPAPKEYKEWWEQPTITPVEL